MMGAMVSRPVRKVKPASKFAFIITRIRSRTSEQTRQSLIKAGIITESGELTAHYKPKVKAKKQPAY